MANNTDDYLTTYRQFFEDFQRTVNPNDQLPVKLSTYRLINVEVVGGIIDWTNQYLTQKKCPVELISPLIKIIIDEVRKDAKKHPISYGFNQIDNVYEPLKLMQSVMGKTNEILQRYLDNSKLCSLPSPSGRSYSITSAYAIKNCRRSMEDRHVVIHDLNTIFNKPEASPSSYYAIFDGHAGHDAAAYSATHLHQFLAESPNFDTNPEKAFFDAFSITDELFLNKCESEKFDSGTTAVCALLRPKDKYLYIAWVGDSQAVLVGNGRIRQCVDPHKPNRTDEMERIIEQGGSVLMLSGTWRVNGLLAVSRAIGDAKYKPHVTGVPEIKTIPLDGNEDFLILACDGLWDFMSEQEAAEIVYNSLLEDSENTDEISKNLAKTAKVNGSSDNISVIVVFLRDPSKIVGQAAQRGSLQATMDTTLSAFTNSNGASAETIIPDTDLFMDNLKKIESTQDNNEVHPQQTNNKFLDFLTENPTPTSDTNNSDIKENKHSKDLLNDEFNVHDMDLGPETDVDTCDDVDFRINNNLIEANNSCSKEIEAFLQEKGALDLENQMDEERDDTPTPPAKDVHDVSGLVETTGCESESEDDEWKFIKGDEANKENLEKIPQQEQQQQDNHCEEEEDDTMSQLNPNAAEFVPVSPVKTEPSPACAAVIFNDQVISQSPNKGAITQDLLDINVPNEIEFENEVKLRPSELFNEENQIETTAIIEEQPKSNGVVSETDNNIVLNGKNIDEIPEFQPIVSGTPIKVDEFHFGPNATPFTPSKLLDQSEQQSTAAVFGDSELNDNDETIEISINKVEDPMSMSFYQDEPVKSDSMVDLNQVQILPDDLNEFLQEKVDDKPIINNDNVEVTDLDDKKYPIEEEKELESPQKEFFNDDFIKSVEHVEETTKDNDLLIDTKLSECDKLNYAQEILNATQETIQIQPELVDNNVVTGTNPFLDNQPIEEQKPAIENELIKEIVPSAPPAVEEQKLEMNEFLERSPVENLLSPIERNDVVIEKELKVKPEIKVEDVKKTPKPTTTTSSAPAKKSITKQLGTKPTTATATAKPKPPTKSAPAPSKPATKVISRPKTAPTTTTITKTATKPVNGEVKSTASKVNASLKKAPEVKPTRTTLTQRTTTKSVTDTAKPATARRPVTASGDSKAIGSTTTKTASTVSRPLPRVAPAKKPISSSSTTAATAKPKVLTRQSISKTTDTEKQIKDNTNKLTKTTARAPIAPRMTLTASKRVESKTTSSTTTNRTSTPRTTTTTVTKTTITKKPSNTLNSTGKTSTITKKTTATPIKQEKPKENGVKQETNNINSDTDLLQKDNSPVDNKMVGELVD